MAVRCFGHAGNPLERNPSPRNLFEHVASDVSSSDFDFPIVGVLGGRAITIGPAMVFLEGANSGDPSGDPLGILGGSESKTGDPGVLYPKKPKESGGSCATSVPLYNIKRKDVWERGEVGVGRMRSVGRMRRSRILLRLRSLSRNLLHLRSLAQK